MIVLQTKIIRHTIMLWQYKTTLKNSITSQYNETQKYIVPYTFNIIVLQNNIRRQKIAL